MILVKKVKLKKIQKSKYNTVNKLEFCKLIYCSIFKKVLINILYI